MFLRFLTAILLVTFFSCTQGKKVTQSSNDCIDTNWQGFRDCTEEYAPVCGCDGKTYSNACAAYNAKIKSWTDGKCAE